MDTTEFVDDLPGMSVSSIDHREKISHDHDGNSNLFFICLHCNDSNRTVNKALLEVVAIAHALTTHTWTEKASTLREFLQAQASNREW